ncbi:hypothetical protein [Acinetobacter sp. YH12136]|uniref:hypothetical protein n=1 Tax=Acinetobacter sp. YH12136 TaxID=2601120 RepID=UPI0015D3D35A|nr:hypothetical protein [Acinetobacter sp. YH12136]
MNGTRWLGIGFFVLAVAVLFTVVYVFQPPNKTVLETVWVKPNTASTEIETTQSLYSDESENVLETNAMLERAAVSAVEMQQLIQQRDQLYLGFKQISTGLSQGQKPDLNRVQSMLLQQEQLVQAGVLRAEDAMNYSQFLKQILPEIAGQIDLHISLLKRLNVVTG